MVESQGVNVPKEKEGGNRFETSMPTNGKIFFPRPHSYLTYSRSTHRKVPVTVLPSSRAHLIVSPKMARMALVAGATPSLLTIVVVGPASGVPELERSGVIATKQRKAQNPLLFDMFL